MSIPRIIHQTWKSRQVPQRWREAQESWRHHHPQWEYRFWTDGDLLELVEERAPGLAPLFHGYPFDIQRVDAARYVILREFGGAYVDLDIACLRPLDPLLEEDGVILAPTAPAGVSNDFMLSEAAHPLFREAVDQLEEASARWCHWWVPRHFRVLLTTGSLFLTACSRPYRRARRLRLLSPGQYGHGRVEEALVRHLPGNSWAGWDTRVFLALDDGVVKPIRALARWRPGRRKN